VRKNENVATGKRLCKQQQPGVFFRQNMAVDTDAGGNAKFSAVWCDILFEGSLSCDPINNLDVPDLWMDL